MATSHRRARDRIVLPPEPASAARGRRLVRHFLAENDLDALVDTATLLVSEVVTNAVVHAATAVELSFQLTPRGAWVGVHDRSSVLPGVRYYDDSSMTGRGLGLVELLADAWGVDARTDGKLVWFTVAGPGAAPVPAPDPPPAPERRLAPGQTFVVRFVGLPVALTAVTIQHGDAVLREVALIALAGADDPTGSRWPTAAIDLSPLLTAIEDATARQLASVVIDVPFPAGAGAAALQRLALAEEAERVAGEGRLLTAPAPPEVMHCRRWYLSQIGLQEEGGEPVPWELPAPLAPVIQAGSLEPAERERLHALDVATVMADEGNRIIYTSPVAADLLGWSVGELTGRRLVTIVPPELREAHLVGFTRYLLTGEARLLGRTVRLPVLRRDGSRFDAEILIEAARTAEGRAAFRARMQPLPDGPPGTQHAP